MVKKRYALPEEIVQDEVFLNSRKGKNISFWEEFPEKVDFPNSAERLVNTDKEPFRKNLE